MEQKKKKVLFYKSAFCPRCLMAGRDLIGLKEIFPYLEVEEVDVVTHPLRAWNDGIRFIPALRSGDKIIAGLLLSNELIKKFIEEL